MNTSATELNATLSTLCRDGKLAIDATPQNAQTLIALDQLEAHGYASIERHTTQMARFVYATPTPKAFVFLSEGGYVAQAQAQLEAQQSDKQRKWRKAIIKVAYEHWLAIFSALAAALITALVIWLKS